MRDPQGCPVARRLALVVLASALIVGSPAAAAAAPAQALLLPPNVQGEFPDADVEALVAGFLERVGALSGGTVETLDGDPCRVPEACLDELPSGVTAVYWLQLSGAPGAALAVAARLLPDGEVRARASGEGADPAALGGTLADAVSEGPAPGLDVLTDRRGAQVYLDGEWLGRTPVRSDRVLPSGRHQVTVVSRDGATALIPFTARAGERSVLELDFEPVPPGPAGLKRRRAWPLVPLIASGLVAGILVATDPAGIVGPDHRVTIVTGR